jgi:hypothetical protein
MKSDILKKRLAIQYSLTGFALGLIFPVFALLPD